MAYVKLDCNILTSSVWLEDSDTLRVWIYLLASSDSEGVVRATVPAIALHNRLSAQKVRAILERFEAPDPDSRTSRNDGRRIVVLRDPKFEIKLLNFEDYRSKDHTNAERQQRYRERQREKTRVTPRNGPRRNEVTQAEAEAEAEAEAVLQQREEKTETGGEPPTPRKPSRPKRTAFVPPQPEEVQAYLNEVEERRFTGQEFVDAYATRGWKVKGGLPVTDWQACVRTWRSMRNRDEVPRGPAAKKPALCRDCKKPLTKAETMEGLTCRVCRNDHGV